MGTKLSQLTSDTAPTLDDLLYGVNAPAGTPASRKWTLDSVRASLRGYAAKTGNYTQATADRTLDVDATGGAVTITLAACASLPVGYTLTVIKNDSSANAVIVDANSAELIGLDTTQILFTQNATLTIVNTGTAWRIAASYGVVNGHIFLANASVTLANDAGETSIIGTGVGTLALPANVLRANKMILHDLSGFISSHATPPTLNIKLKLGSTVIAATGAVTIEGSLANAILSVHALLTCRTVGASGTVIASGTVAIGTKVYNLHPTSGTTVTIDTTASQTIGITAQWGTADAANTLTIPTVLIDRAA